MVLLICTISAIALTDQSDAYETGVCGENAYWTLDDDGDLTISGTGPMAVYDYKTTPFKSLAPIHVTIENGITTIGAWSFHGCSSLTSVEMPSSVTTIGEYAFHCCGSLETVTICDGAVSIDRYAFYGCTSLKSVEISSSVTTIGEGTFGECPSLLYFNVDETNSAYCSVDGVLYSKDMTRLEIYPVSRHGDSYTIPNTVTTIGNEAFKDCTSLEHVGMPSSVTNIGWSAFEGCTSLEHVGMPSSVTNIGWAAFYGCTSLKSMEIPSSVTSIEGFTFESCTSLKTVRIYDGIESIGDYAFSGCSSLEHVEVPSSVTTIGEGAFIGCTSLASVDIIEGLETIGYRAFVGCTSLKSVVIPSSVTHVGEATFYNCISLESVEILSPVIKIDRGMFENCLSLESIEVVETNSECRSIDGVVYNKDATELILCPENKPGSSCIPDSVTAINDYDFCGCKSLTSVVIPTSVRTIGDWAFCGCKSLTSVVIPASVTSMGYSAFGSCTSLESVEICEGVMRIGAGSFQSCTSLVSVGIPSSVTSINYGAFEGCTSLETVRIPSSVTSLARAFIDCTSLASVEICEGVRYIEGAFNGCTSLETVRIPSSVTSLAGAFIDCTSLASVEICEGVESIDQYTFQGCTSLKYVEMPSSVTFVHGNAFRGCTSLLKIDVDEANSTYCSIDGVLFSKDSKVLILYPSERADSSYAIPDTVITIGQYAFNGCTSLASVEMGKGVESIGQYAFNGCTSLASVEMGEGVESIGQYAFNGCTSLTSVRVPSSVTSMYADVFNSCLSLLDIDVDGANSTYCSIDGVLFSKDSKVLILYPAGRPEDTYVIPDSATTIGNKAFTGCVSLLFVEIPESVTSISGGAFEDCDSLVSVLMSCPVESIRDDTFSGCSSLKCINVPETVTSIGIHAFAFSSLSCINIPSSVTSINFTAFDDAELLSSDGKTNLIKTMNSSKTAKALRGHTYHGSDGNLVRDARGFPSDGLYYGFTSDDEDAVAVVGWYEEPTSVNIPSSVTYKGKEYPVVAVGDWAFYKCPSLKTVTIPETVNSIGEFAFAFDILSSVSIPGSVEYVGKWAFSSVRFLDADGCGILEKTADVLGGHSYQGADGNLVRQQKEFLSDGLTYLVTDPAAKEVRLIGYVDAPTGHLVIPSQVEFGGRWYHVTSAAPKVFDGCTGIGSVELRIDASKQMFYRCSGLASVEVCEGVASIGASAFAYCDAISRLSLPSTLESLGTNAFYGFKFLDEEGRTLQRSADSLRGGVFEGGGKVLTKMVPSVGDEVAAGGLLYRIVSASPMEASLVGYESVPKRLVVPQSVRVYGLDVPVTSIGDSAFYGCSMIRSADLGSVSKVGVKAFVRCTGLSSVDAGDSLSTISAYAFFKCTGLTEFDLGRSLKTMRTIGSYAFQYDAKLG